MSAHQYKCKTNDGSYLSIDRMSSGAVEITSVLKDCTARSVILLPEQAEEFARGILEITKYNGVQAIAAATDTAA
jgi:hypothetical protein